MESNRSQLIFSVGSAIFTPIRIVGACVIGSVLIAACARPQVQPAPSSGVPTLSALAAEQATLGSLELVDNYPLYTMKYTGSYSGRGSQAESVHPAIAALGFPSGPSCSAQWGCSLFAALGNADDRLLGRNFDWQFSPALLLFTQPEDGYASVSMVDMEYLGFVGEPAKHLNDLSLEQRRPLLDAPLLPFDGMNERGIAVGMAAVEPGNMPVDPTKRTIGELRAIREMLDHAATVDEAIEILRSHNIDMESVPIHYLIASASGESAVVEFYKGQMVVFRNKSVWQTATNFLLAAAGEHLQGECPRYDRMDRQLTAGAGVISSPDALRLLADVSQDTTQWSVVYHMTSGDLEIVMGGQYSEAVHTFHLEGSGQ